MTDYCARLNWSGSRLALNIIAAMSSLCFFLLCPVSLFIYIVPANGCKIAPAAARELGHYTAGHSRDIHRKVLIYYRRILVGATHASIWEPRHVGSDSAESAM